MNFEKLALASLLEKKIQPHELSVDDFIGRSPRFIFNVIKKYHERFGEVPSIDTVVATINQKIEEDKAVVYIGYVNGLPENIQDSTQYILEGLRTDKSIKVLDDKLETLVDLVGTRDTLGARKLLKELLEATSDTVSTAENAKDIHFSTDNIMMVDCFLPDVVNKLQGVVLISAKSGKGKSIFALQQGLHNYKEGLDVLYFNLELSKNEMMARILSSELDVPFEDIYKDLTPEEEEYYNHKKDEIFSRPNKFKMVNCSVNDEFIENTIRSEIATGCDVVVIDYIQLTENSNFAEQWKFLEKFVKKLHHISLDLGVCIITPIQINEIKDKQGNVTPEVRGSRELEFSSSLWFHITQSDEENKEGLARLLTVKSRHSKQNTYIMSTDFKHMKFHPTGLVM